MKPDIVAFTTDSQLLGLGISPAQETLLRAIYGLPMTPEQREIFTRCTGRQTPPQQPVGEGTIISGSRSGKDSRIAAPVLLFEAVFGGHEVHLHRGEVGVIPLVAQDQRGTRIAFTYLRDYLLGSPLLRSMVGEVLASEITLTNGLRIICFPCVAAALRGWSIPAAVMSEVAFYGQEAAVDSDIEIETSIRRGQVGFPDARLLKVSTPYNRSGVIWSDFQAFGEDDPDQLIWRSTTALMNPSPPLLERIARVVRRDPRRAAREFDAEFVDDVGAFVPADWIADAVVTGRRELAPQQGIHYAAAADPSGGGPDTFGLAICHAEGTGSQVRVVVDLVRGWQRVGNALGAVVAEVAHLLKAYGLQSVVGDRYAAGWVRGAFQEVGISYRDAARDKSAAFLELEPFFAQGRIAFPDHPQLVRELTLLERRLRPGGRTEVAHPRGGHDDLATALAHAALEAASGAATPIDFKTQAFFAPPLSSGRLPVEVFDPALAPGWSRDAGGRTDGERPEDWAIARGLPPDGDAPWEID